MSARLLLAVLAVLAAWALPASAASAQSAPPDLDDVLECAEYPSGDEICSGSVPSFDGSPLDVDLTRPRGEGPSKGLVVMLHGFGSDKRYWESNDDEADGADRLRWNNRWFAKHGYHVLTYTARGFATEPPSGNRPPTPSAPNGSASEPNGDVQLKSRDFEARDTQYLSALVADAVPEVRDRVMVTGNSYGGGESWLLASQSTWTFPNEVSDGALPVVELQVAVPKYGWTDLGYSLAPNGRPGGPSGTDPYESSLGREDSPTGDGRPFGTLKSSYTELFYALGASQPSGFEEGNRNPALTDEGPINIDAWHARVQADPYDVAGAEDPVVKQIRRGLTEFRSSYYQDQGFAAQADSRKVAIFAIQGWTDDLFPAVEAFRQFKALKRLDPRWPVDVAVADIGHPRAQNRTSQWRRLNQQAFGFFQAHITGSHEQETTVSSQPTRCAVDGGPNDDDAAREVRGRTPEDLANGELTVRYTRGAQLTSASGAGDPDSISSGAITSEFLEGALQSECEVSVAPEFPGRYTARSQPLKRATTLIGLGEVVVPYTIEGTTATLNARVWDVGPDGQPTVLVTRGTYRVDVGAPPELDAPSGTLRLALYGNHYPLRPGHALRLDLAQVDAPTYKPSTAGGSLTLGPPTLEFPTRDADDQVIAGS